MKIKIQKNRNENAYSALINLIGLLGVNVSSKSVKNVKYHTNYPSILAISDVLNEWGIDNIAAKISIENLKEIPLPAIAHLSKNGGHFVVIDRYQSEYVSYIDSEVGLVKESITEFEKKWTGVVLLAEKSEKSGEDGFREIKCVEDFNKGSIYLVISIIIIGVIVSLSFSSIEVWPYFLVKSLGAVLSFFLVQKQFGLAGETVSKFCSLGSQSNCDAVIRSPRAKLFGVLHLSELGMLYYVGSILALFILSVSGISDFSALGLISLSFLPLTGASVYFQWRIKAWCPLCLLVMATLWLEALIVISIGVPFIFEVRSTVLTLFSFAIPIAGWFLFRPRFMESFQVNGLQRALYKFNRSERLFQLLLNDQPLVDVGLVSIPLSMGSACAPLSVTMVTNPTCGPCGYAHSVIEDMVERFGERVKVNFRFTIDRKNHASASNDMIRHILALSMENRATALAALHNWFADGGRSDLLKWKKSFPLSKSTIDAETIEKCMQEHAEWILQAGVHSTPTILINGKRLPEEFSITDLKFQIRKLFDKVTNQSAILVEANQ